MVVFGTAHNIRFISLRHREEEVKKKSRRSHKKMMICDFWCVVWLRLCPLGTQNSPIHEKKQKKKNHPKKLFSSLFGLRLVKHTSAARFRVATKTTHHEKTTTQNTHASLLLYILKMALTIMASLAKVRRLFLLLLLLLLLLTLLLSRRVLKRTHHGRRRRRRNNGRRKKITRVVVVWIVVISFNLFSFPSLLLLLSFQTLRASFSSLSLFRSLLLSFVFWCNREEEEDKEEEEEEGFSLSLLFSSFECLVVERISHKKKRE